jgi:hypothetical protein
MFGFDMMANGIRGDFISDHLSAEELEIYGIDWAAYRDERVLRSVRENTTEPASSWIGRVGPPPNLNEVPLYPPPGPGTNSPASEQVLQQLAAVFVVVDGSEVTIPLAWSRALAIANSTFGNVF